jgi:hypothetical protein
MQRGMEARFNNPGARITHDKEMLTYAKTSMYEWVDCRYAVEVRIAQR